MNQLNCRQPGQQIATFLSWRQYIEDLGHQIWSIDEYTERTPRICRIRLLLSKRKGNYLIFFKWGNKAVAVPTVPGINRQGQRKV